MTIRLHGRAAAIAFVAIAITGCGAQRVVFVPTADERRLLAAPPLELSVVVVNWSPKFAAGRDPSAYASHITDLLQASHAFRSVEYDPTGGAVAKADLVAEHGGEYCNSAIIPIFTIVTLGIVPTIWNETDCNGVVFRSARAPSDSSRAIDVHEKRTGKAVMGWAALPLGLFPGWSWHTGRDQPAYQQAFRLAIIRRQAELLNLAGK
jgi:hypothetical protein